MTPIKRFILVNQNHTAQPLQMDPQTNDSEMVLFGDSNGYSAKSVESVLFRDSN